MTTSTVPEKALLLTKRQVCELLQLPLRTLNMLVSGGRFPRPMKFGETKQASVRFVRAEVDAWVLEHAKRREQER